jgi:predicted PurR-regulated permease PerM
VLGLLGSLALGFFGLFTIGLFTFYLSADAPRFRRYIQSLFSPRFQPLAEQVWSVTANKTGSYVAARVVLALINGSTTAVVFFAIGMPSWLALGIWTGLVSQFVPTIGTYIAIALPVLIGLLSGNPWIGIIALLWGILYQQIENLTIEPRISARAVNVHPAVAFASVLLGAALFGVAGALLAVPIVAMASSIVELRQLRFEVPPETPVEYVPSKKRRTHLWKKES